MKRKPVTISTKGKPEAQLFHDEKINVYKAKLKFEKISYWPNNYRTIVQFDRLVEQEKVPLDDIPLKRLVYFLAEHPDLKLPELARSISQNGVRVPLIVSDKGELLDGNRRYFACAFLHFEAIKANRKRPTFLEKIPVNLIKTTDLTENRKLKVIAEANYVPDYKVPWTTEVKARVLSTYYKEQLALTKKREKAIEATMATFGEDRQTILAYVEALELADEFIKFAPNTETNKYRERAQGKFVYFWEYRNKALHGRSPLVGEPEQRTRSLFYHMIVAGHFKSIKQVEPMVRAIKDTYLWELLDSSKGAKIDLVEAAYREQRAMRSAEDKIRNFLRWLADKIEIESLTPVAVKLLSDVSKKTNEIVAKTKKAK